MKSQGKKPPVNDGRSTNGTDIMRIEEAADYLKVSKSWLARSDVPRCKVGGNVLFLRDDLMRYVVARRSHII